jgi:adenine specific DNA methylase Mod
VVYVKQLDFTVNKLILGDNLEILKTIPDECIDLVYLDPPFFSNRNYEVIWGDAGEIRSFEDRWSGKITQYIGWLKDRVEETHRILKPKGSIFLHCDWQADAYIRAHILDVIFGESNFRNEIIWRYTGNSVPKNCFPRKHDTIFWYSKSKDFTFYPKDVLVSYSELTLKRYNHVDENGKRYKISALRNGKQEIVYMREGKYSDDVWEIPVIRGK